MSVIQQGLLITVIGMGLVFAVIIFLWGLMALMMRLTSREKPGIPEEGVIGETEELPAMQGAESQRRSAAAAVAVALAVATAKSGNALLQGEKNTGEFSPWQAYHRTRQIENKKTRG